LSSSAALVKLNDSPRQLEEVRWLLKHYGKIQEEGSHPLYK
jgi:hypothetical protein